MRRASAILIVATLTVIASGCGKSKKSAEPQTPLEKAAAAVCEGKPLSTAPKLPASFPQIEEDKLTYTKQSTQGPTEVVEGYFKGDVEEAHDEFEKELKAAGYAIVFNELEEHDSELSWKGEGRTGQVALREECAEKDKTYVHITNRPA